MGASVVAKSLFDDGGLGVEWGSGAIGFTVEKNAPVLVVAPRRSLRVNLNVRKARNHRVYCQRNPPYRREGEASDGPSHLVGSRAGESRGSGNQGNLTAGWGAAGS